MKNSIHEIKRLQKIAGVVNENIDGTIKHESRESYSKEYKIHRMNELSSLHKVKDLVAQTVESMREDGFSNKDIKDYIIGFFRGFYNTISKF